MKISILTAAATLAALSFTACNNNGNSNEAVPRHIDLEAYSTQITRQLVGSADDYFSDVDILYTDSVSLVMPRSIYGKDMVALRDSILRLAFDTVGNDVNKVIADYIAADTVNFNYPLKQVPTQDYLSADGFQVISGSVVNLSPALLVYEVMTQGMQPHAANGLTTKFYLNYDLCDDRFIDGAFVFAPDKHPELVQLITDRANEMEEKIGPTRVEDMPDKDNFYIDTDGEIVFVYQPFEIASHAQGLISIPFYPAELAPYMTPEAQKYFHVDDLR